MAIRAQLRVSGIAEAVKRVDDVGDRARRPEPALRAAGTLLDLQQGQRRKFRRGGWRKISPEWAERKRRAGLDTRTMRATGQLESALTNATHGVRATVFNAQLTWGITAGRSSIYYAQALAKGVAGKPRRAVVIDKTARESIADRVEQFIATGFTNGRGHA